MIWLILWIISTFFWELSNSILKKKSQQYHFITIWVVLTSFSFIVFVLIAAFKYQSWNYELNFSIASIPLLLIRLILEITQSYITVLAIKHCDRSTFSILRVLTIPLLLIVDIILWYQFTLFSLIWIWIILFSFIGFNFNHKTINWKWWYFSLFTAINAVITISLFKYSIDNYGNSIEIDQWIMSIWTLLFFIIYNYSREKKIWYYLLQKDKIFWIQWLIMAISTVLLSYAYFYLNASEATAIKRAWDILWSVLAWFFFFKEENFLKKILFAFCVIIWLVVMIL